MFLRDVLWFCSLQFLVWVFHVVEKPGFAAEEACSGPKSFSMVEIHLLPIPKDASNHLRKVVKWLWIKKKTHENHRFWQFWSIFPFTHPVFFRYPVFLARRLSISGLRWGLNESLVEACLIEKRWFSSPLSG